MIDRMQSLNGTHLQTKISSSIERKMTDSIQVNQQESKSEDMNNGVQDKEKVEEIVKGLNEFLTPSHTSLKFEFHEKLNEYYVTLVDDNTKEVIREIPSKKMLDFYATMTEAIGLMIDKKI